MGLAPELFVASPSARTPNGRGHDSRGGVSASVSTAVSAVRKPHNEFEFNLGVTKARVLKALDDTAPVPFKRFYNGPLYDRLLNACLLYFTSRFMFEWVIRAMDKARKQHLDGYNPYVVAQRLQELQDEIEAQRLELSPIYSEVILKHSTYDKPQQDRMFFECLYETLINILDDAFSHRNAPAGAQQPGPGAPTTTGGGAGAAAADAAGAAGAAGGGGGASPSGSFIRREDIEAEMGGLFRSKHFNVNKRKNQPARSVDTLGVKELYALKHETTNRALNAKMLGSLYSKPQSLAVQVASVTNSPLISQYISSPIVARAMCKDPQERSKLAESLTRNDPARPSLRSKLSRTFKAVATAHGVDVVGIKDNIASGTLKLSEGAAVDQLGIVPVERARRGDRTVGPKGVMAPESIGLPADEQFNYLALLKRYVLYGPTLGIVPGMSQPLPAVPGQAPPSATAALPPGGGGGGGTAAAAATYSVQPGSVSMTSAAVGTPSGSPARMTGLLAKMGLGAAGGYDA